MPTVRIIISTTGRHRPYKCSGITRFVSKLLLRSFESLPPSPLHHAFGSFAHRLRLPDTHKPPLPPTVPPEPFPASAPNRTFATLPPKQADRIAQTSSNQPAITYYARSFCRSQSPDPKLFVRD